MTITDLLQEEVNKLRTELAELKKEIEEYIGMKNKLLKQNKDLKEELFKVKKDASLLESNYEYQKTLLQTLANMKSF